MVIKMTQPINLYSLSRIHDGHLFNVIETHQSRSSCKSTFQYHEIESLRLLVDNLIKSNLNVNDLDGFFYGFMIPQIGKEFDLLKITEKQCLNIELKSTDVPSDQILEQLLKNRHYLMHLGKKLTLFSVITDSMTCYRLSLNGELCPVSFSDIVTEVKTHSDSYLNHIDDLFTASEYLVSPLNTPEKFIQGEYFLTQQQDQVKKQVLKGIENASDNEYFLITGKPGTGKTLLLYDIAKTLSRSGKTLIIHCGKLSEGQKKISSEVSNLKVVPASELKYSSFSLSDYSFILVDESHRIYPNQFAEICREAEKHKQICIFSSDPEQVLSSSEIRSNISKKIKQLPLLGEYQLSEKIRMNRELNSFITQMRDLNRRPKKAMQFPNVELNYARTSNEAQMLISYYRDKGYVFINYSKSNHCYSPYAEYEEDFDTHHVIGQEFDKVLMLMDDSFYYDEKGILCGKQHPTPDYLYPNLFYQGVTRVREKFALIIVNAPDLMEKITSIIEENEMSY